LLIKLFFGNAKFLRSCSRSCLLEKSKFKEITTEGKIQKLVETQEFLVSSQSTIARF
jgi:hypothetical protein